MLCFLVLSISHADDADDADLPCGVREGNMKTLNEDTKFDISDNEGLTTRSRLQSKHLRNLRNLRAKKSERVLCRARDSDYFSRR